MLINLYKKVVNSTNNIIIKAPDDANVLISELQLIIKLPSISEMTTYADDIMLTSEQRDALFWSAVNQADNKKVAVYWNNGAAANRLIEFIVFRRDPYYTENLLSRFTGMSSFGLQAGTSIGLQVEETNTGLLSANDELIIWGQAEVLGV